MTGSAPALTRLRLLPRRPTGSEHGSVTAETAVVLPVLLAFVVGLVWLVSMGVTQARCVDAAREAARALARHDDEQVALGLARRVAPEGADIAVDVGEAEAEVTVSVQARPPGPLLGALPAISLHATAISALEQLDAQQ